MTPLLPLLGILFAALAFAVLRRQILDSREAWAAKWAALEARATLAEAESKTAQVAAQARLENLMVALCDTDDFLGKRIATEAASVREAHGALEARVAKIEAFLPPMKEPAPSNRFSRAY